MAKLKFTPYSTAKPLIVGAPPSWFPPEEQERIQTYEKYDELYWNDPTQYSLRVLEDESPIFVPNARQIVDTTAHYLLKGLRIVQEDSDEGDEESPLNQFLKREAFLSQFHMAKLSGVARGDWCFHMTADPTKEPGRRLSLEPVHPGSVIVVEDPDRPGKVLRVHLIDHYIWTSPNGRETEERIRKLTYHKVVEGNTRRIAREEAIWALTPEWFSIEPKPKKIQDILPYELLDSRIQDIPVFWFKNQSWQSWWYGASDLKGLETLQQAVSQITTDTQAGLALDGLGVYATDGGRPVDDQGNEVDWRVSPGGVAEVPQGSYFRRVEGIGSITPAMDQINYLEMRMARVNGLTDVALGHVDVAVAQSGIALAIRFSPTLAKIEHRENESLDVLSQMFFNWSIWMQVYESTTIAGAIEPKIDAQKLPRDPAATLNELNNMLDRGVISKQYYREQMELVSGYVFPKNMETQIAKEKRDAAKLAAETAPPGLQGNALAAASGQKPPPPLPGKAPDSVNTTANQSNNANKVNESKGTEA